MNNRLLIAITLSVTATTALGHGTASSPDGVSDARKIEFPDTEKYRTLVLDPHTHSVFSDGHVWPRIRIGEAFRDGLDAIATTEHLEYQPHLADIPHPDRNRSYEEAVLAAGDSDLIVIPGWEITREAPVGHMNAIFIQDANALMEIKSESDPADVEAHYVQAGQWPAHESIDLGVKTGKKVDSIQLDFDVLNVLTAPKTPASIVLSAKVQQD